MKSLEEAYKRWPTEEDCIKYLEEVRWKGRPYCPYCQCEKVSPRKEKGRKRRWQCSICNESFSVTVGTIFHQTHVDLRKWLLLVESIGKVRDCGTYDYWVIRENYSVWDLSRILELRDSTAWRMRRLIVHFERDFTDRLIGRQNADSLLTELISRAIS